MFLADPDAFGQRFLSPYCLAFRAISANRGTNAVPIAADRPGFPIFSHFPGVPGASVNLSFALAPDADLFDQSCAGDGRSLGAGRGGGGWRIA